MNWLYKKNHDNSARFVLGQKRKDSKKLLICFGINPSTATPLKLDRTLSRVKREAIEKTFDGWIMLNLYPQRATDPNKIHRVMDLIIHQKNLNHIRAVFGSNLNLTAWAAWGGLIQKRPFLKQCLRDIVDIIEPYSVKWVNMGKLVSQLHPHHPLYLSNGLSMTPFGIKAYLKKL